MKTTLTEFLNGEIAQIAKYLFDKDWTIEQILEEVQNPDSYQIESMAMYHCPSGRELQDFIHHSRWGQKIKRHIKFLYANRLEMKKLLLDNSLINNENSKAI